MSALPDSEFQYEEGQPEEMQWNGSTTEGAELQEWDALTGWDQGELPSEEADESAILEAPEEPAEAMVAYDNIEDDPNYATMLVMMQYGKWPEVVETLTALKTVYPDEPILDSLLNEAQLKSDLVVQWGASIQGRRMSVSQERLLRKSIPFVLLFALAFVGLSFYLGMIAPSRQVVAMVKENQDLIEEAQVLTQNGQFEDALRTYQEILDREPAHMGALQGIQETRDMMGLVAEYDLAMQLVKDGNVERALTFLAGIQTKSPGFRNVDAQIKQLETLEEAEMRFQEAETAFSEQRWLDAMPLYEQVAEMARDLHAETVDQRLLESYYRSGIELTTKLPAPGAGPEEAQDYLRKGKSFDPEQAEQQLKRLDIYFDGMEALDDANLDEAINLWQGLYDANPAYLGGYLAGRLYAAYLSLAAEEEQRQNASYAQNLYEQAIGLQVEDVSSAQSRLDALIAAAAPTPTPTVKYVASYAPAAAPPPPTATPEPDMGGWIAFRTNRNGPEEIYMMLPDGTQQQPAPAGLAMRFEELLKEEAISWDGARELRVMAKDGRSDAGIYVVDLSLPEGQPRETMITDFHGDEYDPVWAPQGDRIAFVANHTGNDEIWVANPDGTDAYQITWNEWEWDKRPSFSPDGSAIVFYSNRSGWRQIWVMERNGAAQYNLSFNAYDDWDPIWIK